MNILKRYRLKKQQRALMQQRDIYERLQTEYCQDEYCYMYTQHEMDTLDEQAEHIRGMLDGRWSE